MAVSKKTPVREALERHGNELFEIDGVVGFMTKGKTIVVFVVDSAAASRVPKDIEGFSVEPEVTGEMRLH